MIKTSIINCRPTGDLWVPTNPGLGTKLNPWQVIGFLMGLYFIRGHGFGQAKPSGFRPIAIPRSKGGDRPTQSYGWQGFVSLPLHRFHGLVQWNVWSILVTPIFSCWFFLEHAGDLRVILLDEKYKVQTPIQIHTCQHKLFSCRWPLTYVGHTAGGFQPFVGILPSNNILNVRIVICMD